MLIVLQTPCLRKGQKGKMADETFTLITHDRDGNPQEKTVSVKRKRRIDKRLDECQHNQILVDDELWEIECLKCGEKLDPVNYLIRLAGEEDVMEYRLNTLRREYKRINDILAVKTKTRCEHCGKLTTVNTEADINKMGLLLRYVDTQKNNELNKRNMCHGLRDDGICHINHEFYLLRENETAKIYVCKYCGQSITEGEKKWQR